MENEKFLKEQLIAYLGNKRNLLKFINTVTLQVKKKLNVDKMTILDGFSGSGSVARYMKQHATTLYVNDMEKYSRIINESYLMNKSEVDMNEIIYYTDLLNSKKFRTDLGMGIIEKHYAPKNTNNPQPGERCFYTNENAKIIDNIRRTIDIEVPEKYKNIFISGLLYEASVHNNTSGVFKGFYKELKSNIGKFGGNKENALLRIKGEIVMDPIILSDNDCETIIYQEDTNGLVKKLPIIDLAYYDPPYNQHPYGSNYHMLNTIVDYIEPQNLSLVAGIPKNWNKSLYNKKNEALNTLNSLIQNTNAAYIMISYNNEGFISDEEMITLCESNGNLEIFEVKYSAYKASRNLQNRSNKVTEYIFLIETKK